MRYILIVSIILGILATGCSSVSAPNPVSPVLPGDRASMGGSHQLLGLYQFRIVPEDARLDITPMRAAAMHLNALPFLEPPALVNLSLDYLEFNGDQVTADIGLRHPFLGLTEFTGFDVCGIFIASGSVSGFDDAALVMAGDGDTRLMNPDGYTRWWNPAEFPVNEGTMFSYNDGLLGTPYSMGDFNCTLNGYKYYTDDLDANDDIDEADPGARGIFSAGQKNVRRFIIKMDAGLVFNYAVDANWKFPEGAPPYEAPDDFAPDANRPEAWRIDITETTNTLWNDGSASGGELGLSVDVYSHFDAALQTVRIESAGNFDTASSGAPVGGGEGYSTYEIDITDATPLPDSIDLFITVECDKSGYGGMLPGIPQAVYFTSSADVADENPNPPLVGVFVDGDNAGDPLEDGSMEHPFDNIMEGITAVGHAPFEDIYDIYVDPYDDGVSRYPYFKMYNYALVHGYSWNGGPGKPMIDSNSEYQLCGDVDNVLIEGFEIIIALPFNNTESDCIMIVNSDNFTLKDCRITGYARGRTTSILSITNCNNFTLEHNEFVGIRNKNDSTGPGATPWPGHTLYLVNFSSCPGYTVTYNEFHDFGYDDEGDSTTYAWTITYMLAMFDCHNSTFANNLVYDFNDFSDADPVGSPTEYTKNHAHLIYWSSTYPGNTLNFTFANNTFDDLSVTGGDPTVNAQGSATYGLRMDASWVMKNSICSNWHDLTTVPQVNWHRGFWSDGPGDHVSMTYSCCYNYGTPGPSVTVTGFTNYITKGVGSYELYDNQDPMYDMTPGDNWYHVTNSTLVSDDGSEMGAFGGPDGDWLPPSQE